MTVKEKLYRLVDQLPDEELATAERVLEALVATADPVLRALMAAPVDDEPDDDDFDGGLSEARDESRRGESIPHEEVKRRLGL